MTLKRLPRLDKAQLEAFTERLDRMVKSGDINRGQANTIMASMRVAANPQAETAEYGIASLPPERRRIADSSVRETASIFSFGNNFEVPFDEQLSFNEALQSAQTDNHALEWSIVLGLLAYFLFPESQVKSLYDSILKAYSAAWQLAIKEQAAKYGCANARVGSPSGASLGQMKEWAKRDAESIEKTYNREAQSQLSKLYDANPLGAVQYYLTGMAEWAMSRQTTKNLTIGINNVQAGYGLGLQDFVVNNQLKTQFRLVGPAPVCRDCSYLMGLGAVDYDVVMRYGFGLIHPNCPHRWETTKVYKIDCGALWAG